MKLQKKNFLVPMFSPPFLKKVTILDLSEQASYGATLLYEGPRPVYYYSFLTDSEKTVKNIIDKNDLDAFLFLKNVLSCLKLPYNTKPFKRFVLPIEGAENFVEQDVRILNLSELILKLPTQLLEDIISKSKLHK